jgi:hypothetical protein
VLVVLSKAMVNNYITDGDFSLVPESRGIYSWFYPIRIYDEDTYESFIHRVKYFLNFSLFTNDSNRLMVFEQRDQWEKFQLIFQVESRHNKIISKNWNVIKQDNDFKRAVFESSFWNRPLYVGKANNLNLRINQHQSGVTTLSSRFQEACSNYSFNGDADFRFATSLSMKNLLLSYTTLSFSDSHLVSLERILQQTTKPNFSIK